MAGYKEKVADDLDRWIEAGHVAPEKREAILASIPDARRLDAATALAWVGGVLLGIALITFIAANWDVLPRLVRFITVLSVFGAAAGAGAWAAHKERPNLANGLLTFAALAFAAAIGLTGQIFDITGNPRTALYASGLAATALALAGRSSGPAAAALLFIGMGDFTSDGRLTGPEGFAPWLLIAAPLGAALAFHWRARVLAHVSALGVIIGMIWIVNQASQHAQALLLVSALLAGLAAAGRWIAASRPKLGSLFYGWFVWGALIYFIIAGFVYSGDELDIPHRLAWLGAAGGLIALGRHDRHSLVSAAGVVGLIAAVTMLLIDLGLQLMTAAALFFVMALAALVIGFILRRRKAS